MSCKTSKSGAANAKVFMTKWDVNNIDRLTRADFYNDHFQPRENFLIPQGVTYPNERTMTTAMNEIQKELKNGGDKEWKIVKWRRGSRIFRLDDLKDAAKDRKSDAFSPGDVRSSDNLQVIPAPGCQLQRKQSNIDQRINKSPSNRSATKKAARSIFTVHETRKETQEPNQEAVIDPFSAKVMGIKIMENRDLEMAIHDLEGFEQYTHDQLQKILDVNKRFFQLNQHGGRSELTTKQIKNVLNFQETPEGNKTRGSLEAQIVRAEIDSYVEVVEVDDVPFEMITEKKKSVSEEEKRPSSDASSDERYTFAGYNDKSESSLFHSDSNSGEEVDDSVVRHKRGLTPPLRGDTLVAEYIPQIHRSRRTLIKTSLIEADTAESKHVKRFESGGVVLKEIDEGYGKSLSSGTNEPRSKHRKNLHTGDVADNEIEGIDLYNMSVGSGRKGGRRIDPFEMEEVDVKNFDLRSSLGVDKGSRSLKGSHFHVELATGRIIYDGGSVQAHSQPTCKPLRKEPPPLSSIGSSHAVNQRKKNVEIDRENNRLSAKLEKIKTIPPKNSITFRTSRVEQLPFARIQRRISKKAICE